MKTKQEPIEPAIHQRLARSLAQVSAFAEQAATLATDQKFKAAAMKARALGHAADELRKAFQTIALKDCWASAGFYRRISEPSKETISNKQDARTYTGVRPEGGWLGNLLTQF